MKLSEASALFLRTKGSEGFSPHTIRGYALHHRFLAAYLHDKEICDVELQELRDHVGEYGQTRKPASVVAKVRAIKSLFAWLYDEEYLIRNPAKKLHEPRDYVRIPKALTVEEMELLRDSCQTTFEHALIEFFFATGCRVGEVHRLDRSQIDFTKQSVTVLGKGNKYREVYFGSRASIWLRRYLEARKDEDPALFVTIKAPHRLQIHRTQVIFKTIAARCGLADRVTPHVLRHTFATTILDNGAPLHTVQNLLGHDKPETTLLYTRLSGEARKQAYNRYFVQ